MLKLGPHNPLTEDEIAAMRKRLDEKALAYLQTSSATTTTAVSDRILRSKPEKPKGKKARIRELERRIAELEAIVAKMPAITYTSPGWTGTPPWWHNPVVTC